jgi:glycosyltransferase involved in cell wall biosynthesis
LIARSATAEALAEGIEELLADEQKRREMGRQARAAMETRFTADQMARNMTEAFARVVRKAPETSQAVPA